MTRLLAREVRAADLPVLKPAIGRQDEGAIRRTDQAADSARGFSRLVLCLMVLINFPFASNTCHSPTWGFCRAVPSFPPGHWRERLRAKFEAGWHGCLRRRSPPSAATARKRALAPRVFKSIVRIRSMASDPPDNSTGILARLEPQGKEPEWPQARRCKSTVD